MWKMSKKDSSIVLEIQVLIVELDKEKEMCIECIYIYI